MSAMRRLCKSVMVHSQVLQLDTEQEAYTRRRRAAFIMAIAAYAGASWYAEQALLKQPYHTSILSGQMWVRELLGGKPQCIKDQLGMAKHVFSQLILQIASRTSATHTRHVGLDEQVAIFLYTMVTNLSNRKVAEHFQRSGDTISKYVMLPFPWAIC